MKHLCKGFHTMLIAVFLVNTIAVYFLTNSNDLRPKYSVVVFIITFKFGYTTVAAIPLSFLAALTCV